MQFYIYAHYTKDTNELFYIGKGCNNRFISTIGRNNFWKRVVNKHGFIIKKLKENLSESLAFKYEVYFIKKLSPKCNLTLGGSGGNTWAKYSKEEKLKSAQKCSKAKIQFWSTQPLDKKQRMLRSATNGVVKMWAEMTLEERSKEQKRRNSLKPKCPVYCITNGILYQSAKDAAKDLNIKTPCHINRVARGERMHVNSYKFQYVTSDYPTLPNGNMT